MATLTPTSTSSKTALLIFTLCFAATLAMPAALVDASSYFSREFLTKAAELINEIDWDSFGRMNSAAYRSLFNKIVRDSTLNETCTSLVIFIAVIIKSKKRAVNACKALELYRENGTLTTAVDWIDKNCVDYVGKSLDKFPFVKIPESFAPLSMAYYCAFKPNLCMTDVVSQMWFGHMNISSFWQDMHEMFMRFHWTQVVKTTKNATESRDKKRKVGTFYTDIHLNTVNDMETPLISNGKEWPHKISNRKSLHEYINAARKISKKSGMSNSGTINKVVPPRADWKFFHPRYAMPVVVGGPMTRTGDYNSNGANFSTTITTTDGMLAKFEEFADSISLKPAPEVTKMPVDGVTLEYRHP